MSPPVVLDIDLDLFLDGRKTWGDPTVRPSDDEYTPWSEAEIRDYLENRCGLSKDRPVPGSVFDKHDKLFWRLKEEFKANSLSNPIELYHLDAHADLGLGGSSFSYIQREFLHFAPELRPEILSGDIRELNEANWLLFAIACRWINSLTYVHHPDILDNNPDIGYSIMKDFDVLSNEIQLKVFSRNADLSAIRPENQQVLDVEPNVPIEYICRDQFTARHNFSRVYLTHSPGYVPSTSDRLLQVIREYIKE